MERIMAADGALQELSDAMTCPFCQEYFKSPVMLDCGHNFCKACVTRYWVESELHPACPDCRRHFQPREGRPNWHLANVVRLVRELPGNLSEEKRAGWKRRDVCEKHRRALKFFCKDDQSPLCVACKRTQAHKGHDISRLEDAARELKEKTRVQLEAMEEGRKNLKLGGMNETVRVGTGSALSPFGSF